MSEEFEITAYLLTPDEEIQALDARRRKAEIFATACEWRRLARQYESQGRLASAASCKRRADYYNQVEAFA